MGDGSEAEIERIWSEYFVFGIVRNVWARTRSAYLFLNGSAEEAALLGERARGSAEWTTFCKDPSVLARRAFCSGFCHRWIQLMSHVQPQTACLRTVDGRSALDFIGTTESLEDDLFLAISEVNRRNLALKLQTSLPALTWQGPPMWVNVVAGLTRLDQTGSELPSWLSDGGCGAAIAEVYSEDVAWLHLETP